MPTRLMPASADTSSKLVVEQLDGKDHTIVPVVALVEGVIQCATCVDAEFVPAREFAKVAEMWNGRPVTIDHPQRNGNFVSANSQDIIENETIGIILNSKLEDGKLKVEAWINNEKASDSVEGQAFLDKAQSGERIEVSTGYFADVKKVNGVFKGKKFKGSQTDIKPDHLAFLVDSVGACSWEMGCGAPRINVNCECGGTCDTCKDVTLLNSTESLTLNGELSDVDLRIALEQALTQKLEADFFFILAVFSGSVVVERGFSGELVKIGFTISEDGAVTINDAQEVVRPITEFIPVVVNTGEPTMNKDEMIKALVESKATRFEATDEEFLNTLSVEQLEKFNPIDPPEDPEPIVASEPVEPVVITNTTNTIAHSEPEHVAAPITAQSMKPVTLESYVKDAPSEIQEVLIQGVQMTRAKRAALVEVITANSDFDEDSLKTYEITALEKMAKSMAPKDAPADSTTDFSIFAGNQTRIVDNQDDAIPPMPEVFPMKKEA